MLTKGFKNEEQKKLNLVLEAGFKIAFIPDLWEGNQRRKLDTVLQKSIDISLDQLIARTPGELLDLLKLHHFGYSNLVQLADLLIKTCKVEPDKQQALANSAIKIYQYVQNDGDTYHFEIPDKIKIAQTYLKK